MKTLKVDEKANRREAIEMEEAFLEQEIKDVIIDLLEDTDLEFEYTITITVEADEDEDARHREDDCCGCDGCGCEEDDMVNHPKHYTDGNIEVIEFIEDKNLNYHRSSAIKYICRAGKKNKRTEVEDLEKAIWYLQRECDRLILA